MRLPEDFSFSCPLKINCGSKALEHLPVELSMVNTNAPLILANRNQIGRKRVNCVVDAFKASGLTLGIYDRIPDQPEPDIIPVLAGMYRDGGCDSIIAVGSGSVVDTAKHLNLMVSTNDQGGLEVGGRDKADPGPLRPLMLVATDGGNGNEVTGYVSDGSRRLRSSLLIPAVAFIDPVMMGDRNDQEVVNGALIALAHAVEAFLDDSAGPMRRAYAHTAIGLILQYLPMALRNTERKNSLCAVVNGQVAAGCAFFASSPGICHALASELKKGIDLPIGFLMSILVPHLVREAGAIQPDRVGELLYPMVGPDDFALTAAELKTPRIMALLWDFFDALNNELDFNIPLSLGDAGLTEAQIKAAQSHVCSDSTEDHVMRIIDGARRGTTMMAG